MLGLLIGLLNLLNLLKKGSLSQPYKCIFYNYTAKVAKIDNLKIYKITRYAYKPYKTLQLPLALFITSRILLVKYT